MSTQVSAPSTFPIPISNGIFAHCDRIGIAIWVFLWLVDRTTREIATSDGYAEGLVYGGKSIRSRQIAEDLSIATRTVHSHLDRLIAAGYVRRIDHTDGMPSGYAVLRSKKWKTRLALEPRTQAELPSQESANPLAGISEPSQNSALPSQNSALPSQNSAPYIEDKTRTLQRLTTTASELALPEGQALGTLEPEFLLSSTHPTHESSSHSTNQAALPLKPFLATNTPPPSSAPPPAPKRSDDLAQAIEIWNRDCGDTLSKVRTASKERRAMLKARVAEARDRETYFEEFEQAAKLCAVTPFLLGQNDRQWSADFDWLIKNDENLGKVLEAKYGKPSRGATAKHTPANPFDRPEYADGYVAGGQA